MNELSSTLGTRLCKALPAYHALTGCDYTSSFCRKGKVRPLKLLEKDENLQNAFEKLSTETELHDDTVAEISRFVCLVYGKKMLSDTNKARLEIFLDK